jgi:hypothetical protein
MEGGGGHPMCILPRLALVSSFQLDPKYIFHLSLQFCSPFLTAGIQLICWRTDYHFLPLCSFSEDFPLKQLKFVYNILSYKKEDYYLLQELISKILCGTLYF